MVSLEYLSSFWRAFEMSLINCALAWSEKCFLVTTFTTKDTKFITAATLSTQNNV